MNLYLHNDLKKHFTGHTNDLFERFMTLSGQCFRDQPGRLTQRFTVGGENYFIKQHSGVGWKEIVKNLFQLRLPILSAKNEWQAIQKLQLLGVATPQIVGYGKRGNNPASYQSFIIMKELAPVLSLEDLCKTWPNQPPKFVFKLHLIKEVARIARTLHRNGINHRDFYICHFLFDLSSNSSLMAQRLYLIDLHRACIRKLTPKRWIIKDLSGLYFSSKDIGLTRRDLYRFMINYCELNLREILSSEKAFWLKVKQRGDQLYNNHRK